ncbi:murein L,D-transpeptidase [Desulfovibrio sulfodismutans]|uniref:Murein L,D-transpeptidase n=1 Tax=Desulfolutivibrio sulfodismutans TaxID=63561 RepID=A0A7K3NQH6_9BACT|nr:L,D-transpeptidase [Desulfolutivibrio sulfodismutans]NDY58035.1 murein L,D-transpeptidase [Desulfolutivibrio sulfodismutans]QLA11854.1 L,D-transpeptidase family protein [Desulfolutivibrio sulfodismutans DSM 3696]
MARCLLPVMAAACWTVWSSTGLAAGAEAVPGAPGGDTAASVSAAPSAAVSDMETVRREFAQTVTGKTMERLERMKKRKALSEKAFSLRTSRLAAAADAAYLAQAAKDAQTRLVPALGDNPPDQYFVYVDRNPTRQLIFLGFYDAGKATVALVGGDLVSTGLLRRGQDSFLTPTGVFEHLPDNFGYRAQGTKNQNGWRGLGGKGSRVWDFGYQQSPREFRQGIYESQMRLLMHATDPDQGEPRLGRMDSKGCVRVSSDMNRFLDRRSILDRHYERLAAEKPGTWLLAPDRTPVSTPGSFLVVGDTSAAESAAR